MRSPALALLLCVLSTPALAGDGPWLLPPKANNLYLGTDYYRFGSYVNSRGDATEIDTSITASGLTGVWTHGLGYDLEAEFKLPWVSVRVNDPNGSFCENGPDNWCATTKGFGNIEGSLKWRLLDELYFSPITLSVSGGMRSGESHAATRKRLTNLGDGQTDLGAGVALGRTDLLGSGWYRVSLSGWYWYQFSNDTEDGQKIPGDEITGAFDAAFSFRPSFAIGPSVYSYWRPTGVDLEDRGSLEDLDVWGSLRSSQIKVGGKLGVFSEDNGPTFSVTALWTARARNSPADTFVVSFGLGKYLPPPERG